MPNTKQQNYQPVAFEAIKIGLASPEKIREWSHGEVLREDLRSQEGLGVLLRKV